MDESLTATTLTDMMSLPTLPPELIDVVFSCLRPPALFDSIEGTLYEEYQVSKKDLCACSLVCRTWRDLALMHLFRDIRVSYQTAVTPSSSSVVSTGMCKFMTRMTCCLKFVSGLQKSISNFIDFLSHSPHIRDRIRKLRLVFCPRVRPGTARWPTWSTADCPSQQLMLTLLSRTSLPNLIAHSTNTQRPVYTF